MERSFLSGGIWYTWMLGRLCAAQVAHYWEAQPGWRTYCWVKSSAGTFPRRMSGCEDQSLGESAHSQSRHCPERFLWHLILAFTGLGESLSPFHT